MYDVEVTDEQVNLSENKVCSVAIFFDDHYDVANEIVIVGVLEQLKSKRYYTLCIETEHIRTWSDYREILQEKLAIVKQLKQFYKDDETINLYLKAHLPLMDLLDKAKMNDYNFVAIDMTKQEKAQFNLYDTADNKEGYDLKRNQMMAEYIDNACQKYKGNIIVRVGLMHGGLQYLLTEKGYKDIKSFWILNEVTNSFEKQLLFSSNLGNNLNLFGFKLGLKIIDLRSNYNDLKKLENELELPVGSFTKVEFENIYSKLFENL